MDVARQVKEFFHKAGIHSTTIHTIHYPSSTISQWHNESINIWSHLVGLFVWLHLFATAVGLGCHRCALLLAAWY